MLWITSSFIRGSFYNRKAEEIIDWPYIQMVGASGGGSDEAGIWLLFAGLNTVAEHVSLRDMFIKDQFLFR